MSYFLRDTPKPIGWLGVLLSAGYTQAYWMLGVPLSAGYTQAYWMLGVPLSAGGLYGNQGGEIKAGGA
jgi:hypothetical protein